MNKKTSQLKQDLKEILHTSSHTTFTLLKILIPISIIVKILAEFGLISVIGKYLSPAMNIIGLPGETGLIWATAMITNLYGALIVFFTLTTTNVFSVAQITIIAALLLIAHTLPVELRIAQKAGASFFFQLLLRILAAFIFAWILFQLFSLFVKNILRFIILRSSNSLPVFLKLRQMLFIIVSFSNNSFL